MTGIVSYSDVKDHLNLTSDADAGEIARFIETATDVIEQRIGPVGAKAYTESHRGCTDVVILNHAPVISVDSVTEYVYGSPLQLTVQPIGSFGNGYALDDLGSGLLRRRIGGYASAFRGPVVVTYTAGRAEVPAAIKTAALMIIGHMWDSQRGASPLPSLGGEPPLSVRYSGGMPPFVNDLLAGYDMRIPGVA